jgi:hypothetical protein
MNSSAIPSIHVATTSETRPSPGRFERALQGAAAGLAGAVELAAPFVPGGTVVSAAVRSATAAATGTAIAAAATTGTGGETDVLAATRALQQQSQSDNLQYLQLQEDMQRENRQFTTLSNVLRVEHDSARAAIQNIH